MDNKIELDLQESNLVKARVEKELAALKEKTIALHNFQYSEKYERLHLFQKSFLSAQLSTMEAYESVLECRLSLWDFIVD